jgi:hypothetical protein
MALHVAHLLATRARNEAAVAATSKSCHFGYSVTSTDVEEKAAMESPMTAIDMFHHDEDARPRMFL